MKEKLTNNFVLKISSVLFAIIVWLIVLNINDPNKTVTISDIPVEIVNDDAITSLNKAYSIATGKTCTISISGPRSIVDKLDESDFSAVADINELSLTNSVPIDVELKKNTYKSKVDITVKTVLKLNIEDIIEKEYEVAVQYKGKVKDGYVVTKTELETNTVIITAPSSQIEKISSVVAVVDVTNKSGDFEATTKLQLLDVKGTEIKTEGKQIGMSFDSVKSSSVVLYKKELPIVYELPENIGYDTLISGDEVSVKSVIVIGRKEVLDGIESIVLPIDLEEYEDTEENIVLTYKIDDLLPDNVYNYTDTDEIVLNIYTNSNGYRTITTKAKNISISNIPDGLEASLVTKGNVSFTIRGLEELVQSLDIDDIDMKVDVGELNEGTHNLKVIITLPDGLEVTEDVYVEVSLAKQDDSTNGSSETQTSTIQTETSITVTESSTTPSETTLPAESSSEEETDDTNEETTSPMGDEEATTE